MSSGSIAGSVSNIRHKLDSEAQKGSWEMTTAMNCKGVSRRRLLQLLVAAGGAPALAEAIVAETQPEVSPERLKVLADLLDRKFDQAQLETLSVTVQRSLDTFQLVRELDIDDRVQPCTVFQARPPGDNDN